VGLFDGMRVKRLVDIFIKSPSPTDSKARTALDQLKEIGKPAVPALIEGLNLADRDQAKFIKVVLVKILNNSTLSEYTKGLKESFPRIVSEVTSVLKTGQSYDPNLLIDVFGEEGISKAALIDVLAAHKDKVNAAYLMQHLNRLDIGNQNAALKMIGDVVDESAIPELISRLGGKDQNIRAHIARILGRFKGNPEVLDALEKVSNDSSKQVRFEAAQSLIRMGEEVDLVLLIQLLKDSDIRIQEVAVQGLVNSKSPDVIKYLIDPLQDSDEYVRRAAVEVLNEMASADSIKDLLDAIRDRDWWVRERAADALAKIGGPKVIEAMLELIKDEDKFIRRTAVEVINSSTDPRTLDYLIEALNDNDWWVRERTVDALAQAGNRRAVKPLMELATKDKKARPIIMQALVSIGDKAVVRQLLPFLDDPEPNVQIEVLNSLSALTEDIDAEFVIDKIFQKTSNAVEEVKSLATEVVKEISENCKVGSSKGMTEEEERDLMRASHTIVGKIPADEEEPESAAAPKPKPAPKPKDTMTGSTVITTTTGQILDLDNMTTGQMIGDRYQFIRRVGKGAFGTVILVNDTHVDEQIVLKFINTQMASDEGAVKRFIHELRYTRKITHPNVIRIYDLLNFGTWSAISMEYFDSHTLGQEIKKQRTEDVKHALNIIDQICKGMEAAHKEGVIHRDMKPANILIDEQGLVKVVDFGIAAAARNSETRLTKTGTLVGTPTYIAPEQVLGKPVDNRTDIYSLGVIMYEMLSGKPPYQGEDYMSLMYQHVQGGAPLLYTINPEISKTLSAVVAKAMATDPDKRYQTMDELRQRIELLMQE
jgi:serine/threonine-protein kinase